jgi:hypothetical protein
MQDFAPFTQSFWGPSAAPRSTVTLRGVQYVLEIIFHLFIHFYSGKYLAHTYKNIAFIYSVRNKKMMYDKTTGL